MIAVLQNCKRGGVMKAKFFSRSSHRRDRDDRRCDDVERNTVDEAYIRP